MTKYKLLTVFTMFIFMQWACTSKQEKMENEMRAFIRSYEEKAIPLYRESSLASWNANVSGTAEDYSKSEKASFEYARIFTDTAAFAALKKLKESGEVKDSLLSRQLDLLYNAFL